MGGVRDARQSRSIGYPIWASEITLSTGKWRLETVEINGEIQMGDVRVNPGDLMVVWSRQRPSGLSFQKQWLQVTPEDR
jgi:regulator of RNase E activity RraA